MRGGGIDLGPTGRRRGRGRGREAEVAAPNQFVQRLIKHSAIQLINLGAI